MDPVIVVAAVAGLLLVIERLAPGVKQPKASAWIARLVVLNAAQIGVVYLGALSWDRWLPQLRLWDGARLGYVAGVALGYVAITFVFYWWHRARHRNPFLWRWLHQIHHSPVRIEVLTSFYKHPAEIALNGFLVSIVLHVLVGLPAASAAAVVAISGVGELIYHWNVRTPYWLGFFFQRPESHRRHHQRDWHDCNYSDLPLWDILFGTFDNPRETPAECGFAAEQELQLGRMLGGRLPR